MNTYLIMPSDRAFERFLHNVGPWSLSPAEWMIYMNFVEVIRNVNVLQPRQ